MAWGRAALMAATAVVIGLPIGALGERVLRGEPAPMSSKPMAARSPSVPGAVPITVAADPSDPPALSTRLNYQQVTLGTEPFTSTFEVPADWEAIPLEAGETRWTPPGSPEDTHSIRVERIVSERQTSQQMVDSRAIELAQDTSVTDLKIITRSSDALTYSYLNQRDRRRWGMLRWLAPGAGELAELEVAVVGREMDRLGLAKLLEHTAESALQ
jgi:hypothetical protein